VLYCYCLRLVELVHFLKSRGGEMKINFSGELIYFLKFFCISLLSMFFAHLLVNYLGYFPAVIVYFLLGISYVLFFFQD
jgi:hypothetical protein